MPSAIIVDYEPVDDIYDLEFFRYLNDAYRLNELSLNENILKNPHANNSVVLPIGNLDIIAQARLSCSENERKRIAFSHLTFGVTLDDPNKARWEVKPLT